MSLPSRERGLKSVGQDPITIFTMSLPSRERGLKSDVPDPPDTALPVAPLAGAWIEMWNYESTEQKYGSLPSRERGLKC